MKPYLYPRFEFFFFCYFFLYHALLALIHRELLTVVISKKPYCDFKRIPATTAISLGYTSNSVIA